MPESDIGVLLFIGAIFFLIGLLGGGFEISSIKIPSVGKYPRIFSLAVGAIFWGIAIGRLLFLLEPSPVITPTPSPISIASPTSTSTVTVTETPMTATNTPVLPTNTLTSEPTNTSIPTPTDTQTPSPTNTQTLEPTTELTEELTQEPSAELSPLLVANFKDCIGVNNLSGPMGAAYNPPNDRLSDTYVPAPEGGCVVRLEYNIEFWGAFWMKLRDADLTPYSKLTFDIRADSTLGIPTQMKIELKRANNAEVAILYVSRITTEWQTMSVNLPDFGPVPLSKLTDMNELVFTFETDRSGPAGVVYLDNIIFEP